MLKKKIIVPILLLGILFTSYSVCTNAKDANNSNKGINNIVVTSANNNSKSIGDNKKFTPKIKHQEITDKNKIKNNFPIKEEKPTVDLGDLKEVSIVATQDTYNPDFPQYTTNSYRIITKYKSSSGKELIIVKGDASDGDETSLSDTINKTDITKVNGIDAVISESKGGYTQVIFIKNKKFYNVMGYKIDKTYLVKIAESLKELY